jgi:hypothetical protein
MFKVDILRLREHGFLFQTLIGTMKVIQRYGDQKVLFHRPSKGIKKWRTKAMLMDPHKTLITIELSDRRKHVPPWVYKNLVEPTPDVDGEQ